MSTTDQQAKAPADLKNVAVFLRGSSSGIKARTGVLNGKRIDYFKGKSAIKALLSPAYAKQKNVPKVESETDATKLLGSIIPFAFYLRVDRGAAVGSSSGPKLLTVNPMQMFQTDDYYAWFYDGPQWTTYVGGAIMVVVILAGVMFPLWPPVMRQGVGWLSYVVLGLIGLLFAIAIVRLIFYIITVIVASPGIWVFPNLFADVGFIDSFIPFWEWDIPKKKGRKGKKGEKSKKGEKEGDAPQGAFIEEVVDSGSADNSRPASTAPGVETPQ